MGHLSFIGDHLVGEVWAGGPLHMWACWCTHGNATHSCYSRRSGGSTAWAAEWQWKRSDFFIAHLLVWRHPSGPPPRARDGRAVLWEECCLPELVSSLEDLWEFVILKLHCHDSFFSSSCLSALESKVGFQLHFEHEWNFWITHGWKYFSYIKKTWLRLESNAYYLI